MVEKKETMPIIRGSANKFTLCCVIQCRDRLNAMLASEESDSAQ